MWKILFEKLYIGEYVLLSFYYFCLNDNNYKRIDEAIKINIKTYKNYILE